jgi:hypothetical protein
MIADGGGVDADATHPECDSNLPAWLRARDVLAGEDAVKAGGERYLPRLEAQTDGKYAADRARTVDGYLGLVFRRSPLVKMPDVDTAKNAKTAKEGGGSAGASPGPYRIREPAHGRISLRQRQPACR